MHLASTKVYKKLNKHIDITTNVDNTVFMKENEYTLVDNTSLLRTTALTAKERQLASNASKLLGLRRSEFYKRAIIEKARMRKLIANLNNFRKYLHYNYDEQRKISFNSACL